MDALEITSSKESQRSETITKLQKDDSCVSDVSKGQLEVRYKRFHEQFSTLYELLSKVTLSVSRLESENNSLREQNNVLLKLRYPSNRRLNSRSELSSDVPSAARAALELAMQTVGNMSTKFLDFEKVALLQRTSTDTVKKENEDIKSTLEEVKSNLQQEKKKSVLFQEKLNSMENRCLMEATMRLAAERRLSSLQKEVQDLSDELSAAHCCEIIKHNYQRSDNNTHHASPVSDDVVITSTHHTGTGKSFRESTFMTSSTENKFQIVFSGMRERCSKFGSKLQTFVGSRKLLIQMVQNDVMKSVKKVFKSKPPNMPTNYMESMPGIALD